MRSQSGDFLRKLLEKRTFDKVLEVGSADVNGTIHQYVTLPNYIGVDMVEGGNVHKKLNAHNLTDEFKPETFDLVLCFDTLEHDDNFLLTVEQMKKVLKTGGYLVIGVPGRNCPYHAHPKDYWRFMEDGIRKFFENMEDVNIEIQTDDNTHVWEDELYGWGMK